MTRYCVLIICFLFSLVRAQTDYCQLCSDHTVCQRKNVNCGAGTSCGASFKQIGLTEEDIASIMAMHNSLRNKVATGQETSGGQQPSASNMNVLSYNKELGYIAQCLTNACQFQHDSCRSTAKYSWVGQNLGIQSFSGTLGNYKSVINSTIQSWYNEVKDFSPSWVSSFNKYNKTVGHYTQVVWANTKEVGCGITFFVQNGWNKHLFACNYGPGGNIIGQPVYKVGPPASDCSGQPVNSKYSGLCENGIVN